MKGYLVGRLLVSLLHQPAGAPFADECFSRCAARPGVSFRGWAFLLRPWRHKRWGARGGGLALAVTWQGFRLRPQQSADARVSGANQAHCLHAVNAERSDRC
jgi:hypothetical protein